MRMRASSILCGSVRPSPAASFCSVRGWRSHHHTAAAHSCLAKSDRSTFIVNLQNKNMLNSEVRRFYTLPQYRFHNSCNSHKNHLVDNLYFLDKFVHGRLRPEFHCHTLRKVDTGILIHTLQIRRNFCAPKLLLDSNDN